MLAKLLILCSLALVVIGAEKVLPADDCANVNSDACHNFNTLRQNAINSQINMELTASYVYMAMGAYFSRDDPNHMGFAKFFYDSSEEERQHALKFIEYQNTRGGKFTPTSIAAPTTYEWPNGLKAMEEALALEKKVNAALLKLHQAAEDDPQMQDFIEANYLDEQVKSIRQLAGYVSELKHLRVTNPGLGEHIFDQKLK